MKRNLHWEEVEWIRRKNVLRIERRLKTATEKVDPVEEVTTVTYVQRGFGQ
jgi:hypothetical protein